MRLSTYKYNALLADFLKNNVVERKKNNATDCITGRIILIDGCRIDLFVAVQQAPQGAGEQAVDQPGEQDVDGQDEQREMVQGHVAEKVMADKVEYPRDAEVPQHGSHPVVVDESGNALQHENFETDVPQPL